MNYRADHTKSTWLKQISVAVNLKSEYTPVCELHSLVVEGWVYINICNNCMWWCHMRKVTLRSIYLRIVARGHSVRSCKAKQVGATPDDALFN